MEALPEVCLASLQNGTETDVAVPWSGTRALMAAVLEDAIQNLGSSVGQKRAEAERWITSPEKGYVFSFTVICETLKLSPSAVRRSVLRLVDRAQSSRRLLPRIRSNVRHTEKIHRGARGRAA